MLEARSGSIPEEVEAVAKKEGLEADKLRMRLAEGRVIIPRNFRRSGRVNLIGVGEGLSTKVNVNIGTSATVLDLEMERAKAGIAVKFGSDTIMDLSTGGDLDEARRVLMEASEPLPFGTVPTYQVWIDGIRKFGGLPDEDFFLKVVERHLKDGVDFMTIHAGLTRDLAEAMAKSGRVAPTVSRGGAMLAAWMLERGEENPYYKNWDLLLEMFAEYDAVISLGDALRPGALSDSQDALQISELVSNARLLERAREGGVQAMIEGPGHMPIDRIASDVRLMKSLTRGAPYYVLGPLVTDVAVGYDHIAAAIGSAIAAAEGADLICYLTSSEHLSLPNPEQVKTGLIASKIAAHAGDIVKLGEKARRLDYDMSIARARLDWKRIFELSMDSEEAERVYRQFGAELRSCNMCGPYCVFIVLDKYLKKNPT
ncbi:MAG: phosphomethylpyrimidine synthase ThiC [Nitrososphaerota archaeon]|nr:phosphomethylpyrimidine synthase ThiC [Candidatus Bathyarchaeota archaeon]MDW8049165.1 phosphomethylpyrimidine synthase ThiC [Nitrososphaerota archaeon]